MHAYVGQPCESVAESPRPIQAQVGFGREEVEANVNAVVNESE